MWFLPFSHASDIAPALYGKPSLVQWPRIPYFFTLSEEKGLEEVLQNQYQLFLEIGEYHALDASLMHILSSAPDFALSLTTPTAYRGKITHTICRHLCERFNLPQLQISRIATCLQEALIKSVIHGNCAMDPPTHSLEHFDEYYAQVEKRLSQPPYKDRRLSIAAWNFEKCMTLAVGNQGREFSVPAASPSLLPGHELFVIQAMADKVWIGDDQRTIFMTFSH